MLKTTKWLLPALGLLFSGAALAQSTDGPKFYKLDFTVKEVEGGKTINSRAFSTMLPTQMPGQNQSQASIRAGGKVPVTNGTSVQFYDLGVNLDLRELRETSPGEISVLIMADISTLAQPDGQQSTPVLRQNRWNGTVLTTVKKPTVVFASDDLASKRQLQLEVTATPVK